MSFRQVRHVRHVNDNSDTSAFRHFQTRRVPIKGTRDMSGMLCRYRGGGTEQSIAGGKRLGCDTRKLMYNARESVSKMRHIIRSSIIDGPCTRK